MTEKKTTKFVTKLVDNAPALILAGCAVVVCVSYSKYKTGMLNATVDFYAQGTQSLEAHLDQVIEHVAESLKK